jgi:hypothetical protein
VRLLGDAVRSILASPHLLARLPAGTDPQEWVATYLQRPETHPRQ